MDQLVEAAMNQNFVPVVDDRGVFIGIVRRQAIIKYCYDKSRRAEAGSRRAQNSAPVLARSPKLKADLFSLPPWRGRIFCAKTAKNFSKYKL